MAFENLAPQIIQGLSRDLDLTPQQAAGIVGQLGYESDGLQAINERNPVVPGSRGGFGWAQWTGPRRRAFEAWTSQNGLNVTDPNANYGFLLHELRNTPEGSVLEDIRKAPDAQAAGRIFTDKFLRPGIPAHDKRASWTDRAMEFIIPTARAGTLDDEWAALESQFMQGAQPVATQADEKDPWAELERKYAPPTAQPAAQAEVKSQHQSVASNGDTVRRSGPEPDPGGYGRQVGSGLLEGVTGLLGMPVDLANAAVGLGMKGVNSAFGTNLQPSSEPFMGTEWWRRGTPIAPPSEETGPQMARRVAQSVGGAAIPVATGARTAAQLAAGLGTALGGGVGGAAAKQMYPGNTSAEMLGEVLGGLGAGGAIAGLANRSARRAAESAVPTVEQLKTRAAGLYDEAERAGVTATQAQTQGLADDFRTIAQKEGLITPTGRVSEAYPRAAEALRVMDDYSTGPMTPIQMQVVRDTLSDAANATKGKERRIASMMLDEFDNFTAPLAPQLAEARSLYARALRGDKLETLSELAGARAGQFSGSGYENALRTEYRALDRRITKRQELGWTPEQIEAINRVSRGTGASNTLRNLGRMAPTGVVSYGLSGGVPFMVGNAIGGPALGGILSGATMGGGFLARDLATRYGIRHAEIAEMLARNGGAIPVGNNPNLWPQMLGAALGGQAALRQD